jgi:epoxyqueuosine reductase
METSIRAIIQINCPRFQVQIDCPMPPPEKISQQLKVRAQELGFQLTGVCPAVSPTGVHHLDQWLESGYAGQMDYLASRREAYQHPSNLLAGSRSILMLGMHYQTVNPETPQPGQGRISRYAWGEQDYHDLIRQRLHQLADWFRELLPGAKTRGVVDTAPLLEREFAQLAGLGWVGKNTLLLNPKAGSYFFLAALLTDQTLAYDTTQTGDHCGTCSACLDACPTGAFVQPYVLDATRCISYLTIEHHDAIAAELRPQMDQWLFGCDVCQEVCPWNRFAPQSSQTSFAPRTDANPADLISLFELDDPTFRQRYRQTPLWRAHRRGLLRNAAILLGNQQYELAQPALALGLADQEPVVRGASAWALGQLANEAAQQLLRQHLTQETDPEVRQEIVDALK